ncbi:PEP-CTERM sorting domain-containing protein, partial [bacterium]
TGGGVAALAPGTIISGSSTFNAATPLGTAVATGTPVYFGFRFRNEGANLASTADDTVHYGFAQVILTQGRPGTLVRYAYESTPLAPITVGASAVPEPATLAALGLGAAAMIRRRRKSA